MLFTTGGAGRYFAFGDWVWASSRARFPRSSGWLASPRGITRNSECPAAGLRAPAPRGPDRSGAGDTAGPFAASSVRMGTLAALYQVVPTIIAVGTTAPRSHLGATPAAPTRVTIQDIVYQVEYAGNLAHGGFGPALQEGCWGCARQAAPGGSLVEMAMLTDNRRAQPLTVTSVSVLPPFQLLNGPHVPEGASAARTWMFDVTLGIPPTPGEYTVDLVSTHSEGALARWRRGAGVMSKRTPIPYR